MPQDPWRGYATRIARLVKAGDHDGADQARRDLRAARLEAAIKSTVDALPPLTEKQKAELRALLAPSSIEHQGAA